MLVRSAFKAVYDPVSQRLLYTRDGPTLIAHSAWSWILPD